MNSQKRIVKSIKPIMWLILIMSVVCPTVVHAEDHVMAATKSQKQDQQSQIDALKQANAEREIQAKSDQDLFD